MFEIEYHESFEYYKFLYRQKVGKGKMKHIRDHMWDRPENGGIRDMPKDDNIIQTITDEWIQQYTNEMEYKDVKKKKTCHFQTFYWDFFPDTVLVVPEVSVPCSDQGSPAQRKECHNVTLRN